MVNQNIFWQAAALFLAAAIFAVQQMSWMNVDNGWLLFLARKITEGARLNIDFIETNPPLITYVMTIPVHMADLLGISDKAAFSIFVLAVSALSFLYSCRFISDPVMRGAALFGLIVLPGNNLGEREHLMVALILPYVSALLAGKRVGLAALLMAGLGFAIKPFFLALWVAIEGARFMLNPRCPALRERGVVAAAVTAYFIYVMVWEKVYVHDIVPLLVKYYWTYQKGWGEFVHDTAPTVAFTMFLLLLFVEKPAPREKIVLMACMVGSVLVLVSQRKAWGNHFYPLFFFWTLSSAFAVTKFGITERWRIPYSVVGAASLIIVFILAASGSYKLAAGKDEDMEKLMAAVPSGSPKRKLLGISLDLGPIFPLVNENGLDYCSRYAHLWTLMAMYVGRTDGKSPEALLRRPEEMSRDEKMVFDQVVEDAVKCRPDYIAVNDKAYVHFAAGKIHIDLVKYFSQSQEFRNLIKGYSGTKAGENMLLFKRKEDSKK